MTVQTFRQFIAEDSEGIRHADALMNRIAGLVRPHGFRRGRNGFEGPSGQVIEVHIGFEDRSIEWMVGHKQGTKVHWIAHKIGGTVEQMINAVTRFAGGGGDLNVAKLS